MKDYNPGKEKPATGESLDSDKINSLLSQIGQKGPNKGKVWAQRSKSIHDYQKYVSAKGYNPKIT